MDFYNYDEYSFGSTVGLVSSSLEWVGGCFGELGILTTEGSKRTAFHVIADERLN
jgi:hypothetical protein